MKLASTISGLRDQLNTLERRIEEEISDGFFACCQEHYLSAGFLVFTLYKPNTGLNRNSIYVQISDTEITLGAVSDIYTEEQAQRALAAVKAAVNAMDEAA